MQGARYDYDEQGGKLEIKSGSLSKIIEQFGL
jgi:hypothetical protein